MSLEPLLLPLGAGLGYACGAIAVKRALGAGFSGKWVNFLCNGVLALFFQLFWFLPGHEIVFSQVLAPVLCGTLFFLGQIFTFRAIATGDVSVATPLLGAKVILVSLFSFFLVGRALPASWWFASLLASLGIALISCSPGGFHRRLVATVGWSLGAAALFALTDVLLQQWVTPMGYSRFAPVMFGTTGVLSLLYLPGLLRESRHEGERYGQAACPVGACPWLLAGALLLSLQALALYASIGFYGSATVSNILYGSRCLWSVLLVWFLGTLAGEMPVRDNRSLIMGCRFVGAALLFFAMALVLH